MESAMTGKLEPSIPATAYSSLHQVVMPAFVCTSCILPNQMTARYADQRSMSSNVVRQATWYVEQCGTSRSVVHRAARKWSGAACQAAQYVQQRYMLSSLVSNLSPQKAAKFMCRRRWLDCSPRVGVRNRCAWRNRPCSAGRRARLSVSRGR